MLPHNDPSGHAADSQRADQREADQYGGLPVRSALALPFQYIRRALNCERRVIDVLVLILLRCAYQPLDPSQRRVDLHLRTLQRGDALAHV